jgi:hypothetical protein
MWSTLGERFALSKKSIGIAGCLILMASSLPLTRGEDPPNKPTTEWTQDEALRVLNDSPWAHTVTPTTQDTACDFEHPVFPGLFSEDQAALRDAGYPAGSVSEAVKPDTAEYLVRWLSAKPVQAAIERMMALNDVWSFLAVRVNASDEGGPTNVEEHRYNIMDMITIAVILEHPGTDGLSFLDYAFSDHGHGLPSPGWHVWPCAGLKTPNGQVHADLLGGGHGFQSHANALELSFPRLVHGKPLITHANEKVEFRFVAKQRVFETTFTVDPKDLLDGSEPVEYLVTALDDMRGTDPQ